MRCLLFFFILIANIVFAQNPHDIPSTALSLTITAIPQFTTMDNIDAQVEDDETQECGSQSNPDVFATVTTDSNTDHFTIHVDNIASDLNHIDIELYDSNFSMLSYCYISFEDGDSFLFSSDVVKINSVYYLKIIEGGNTTNAGFFDIAVTSNPLPPGNDHDVPSTALSLSVTATPQYIQMNNINAQIEGDDTNIACSGQDEYDVFASFTTNSNMQNVTIHLQNIDPDIILMMQVLDSNFNQIGCSFYVGSGMVPFGSASPNSTYYLKFLDNTGDGLDEGFFDITVTSEFNDHDVPTTALPLSINQIPQYVTMNNINSQIEEDSTPDACISGDDYDVFATFTTDSNISVIDIHWQDVESHLELHLMLLDDTYTDLGCIPLDASGIIPDLAIDPNSTYYLKFVDDNSDGNQDQGNFDIAVSSNAVLPITLLSFDAHAGQNNVNLTWLTTSETNNKGFEVLHSINETDWEMIAWVDGVGNSTGIQEYAYVHTSPSKGHNYYRLRQVDFDNRESLHQIRSVFIKDAKVGFSIYPNPVSDILIFSQAAHISLYSINGELLIEKSGSYLNVSHLQQGVYFLYSEYGVEKVFKMQ